MATIAEHLQYLNESRELLKLAIQEKGGVLTDTDGLLQQLDQVSRLVINDYANRGKVPSLTGNEDYNYAELVRYLNRMTATFDDIDFSYGVDPIELALLGEVSICKSVYSPTQNRIYYIPTFTALATPTNVTEPQVEPLEYLVNSNWFYLDCYTGKLHNYDAGFILADCTNTYSRGQLTGYNISDAVYCPHNDRIYVIPGTMVSGNTQHYIDCTVDSDIIKEFTLTLPSGMFNYIAISSATYDPLGKKIYIFNQQLIYWFTLDTTNDIVSVTWAPTLDESFDPATYMDMETGMPLNTTPDPIVRLLINGYVGSCYSPTQKRIYLTPLVMGPIETIPPEYISHWHFIDCASGELVEYEHGVSIEDLSGAGVTCEDFVGRLPRYQGSVYCSKHNRIYFMPFLQIGASVWHYIDCSTGFVKSYANTMKFKFGGEYNGGTYSPITDRIYLTPFMGGQFNMEQQLPQLLEKHPDFHELYPDFYDAFDANYVPILQYIDCKTNTLVDYCQDLRGFGVGIGNGTYSPTQNRVYLTNMFGVSPLYIQEFGNVKINPKLCAR